MSIAVPNLVWANSPTSGNERLVLLALADACSREDGTGCWSAARTIARKANITDRTVRRVIARLEAGGHVLVHRGGGRAGATNSYTVGMGVHSPGQSVTPDELSGGDSGVRGGVSPVSGPPDTAVSRDPPERRRCSHMLLSPGPSWSSTALAWPGSITTKTAIGDCHRHLRAIWVQAPGR